MRRTSSFASGAIVVLGVGAIIALLWVGRAPLGGALWRVLAPVVALRAAVFQPSEAQLEEELASTTAALADRNALAQENSELKRLLGRQGERKTILAGVLQYPPQIPYDTLIIDAGSDEGVVVGDAVSAGGTTLIGTVSQVYGTTARVALFSSPGSSYDALLGHAGATVPLPVVGQGQGSLSAEVPAGTPVAVGDPIVAPGIAGGYLGSVARIEAPDNSTFETLYITAPASPSLLHFVQVVLP
ncbi:MAG: rod shape-determining protein MreC [Patescibacteria group bacterium]|nr:rod shape-determining protein MreC [Patescibacteria group bacterium]